MWERVGVALCVLSAVVMVVIVVVLAQWAGAGEPPACGSRYAPAPPACPSPAEMVRR